MNDIKIKLGMSEWFIYLVLQKEPGIRNQEIADRFNLNKSSCYQVLKRLESKSIIKGIRNPKDKREVNYYLNEG